MKKILNYLKGLLGPIILEKVLRRLITKENVIKAKNYIIDKALDPLEDYCDENNLKWAKQPLLTIRETLNVPDNDKPKTSQ